MVVSSSARDAAGVTVRLHALQKWYDGNVVIDNFSHEFTPGTITAVLGTSGAGKSTLLKIIAGQEMVTSGSGSDEPVVSINGVTPFEFARHGGIGIAFQEPVLLPWRTVRRNIRLALELRHRRTESLARAYEVAGIDRSFENKRPAKLSGGQAQRTALARAIVSRPGLLLLDEPFASLDEQLRRQLTVELRNYARDEGAKLTVLMVTHSFNEAAVLAHSLVRMSCGKTPAVQSIDAMLRQELDGETDPFASGLFATLERRVADFACEKDVLA